MEAFPYSCSAVAVEVVHQLSTAESNCFTPKFRVEAFWYTADGIYGSQFFNRVHINGVWRPKGNDAGLGMEQLMTAEPD